MKKLTLKLTWTTLVVALVYAFGTRELLMHSFVVWTTEDFFILGLVIGANLVIQTVIELILK